VSRPSVDTDRRPMVLVWEVTQACELACDHCRAEATPARHPDELTTEEGKALLEDAAEFGDGQLVVLSGGDPLKRDDLVELVEYGSELGLRMTLTPSGTESLARDRLVALREAGLRRLALSLDGGSAATHDDFRGEPGCFERTMAAARTAREVGLPIQINTTVCEATVDDLLSVRDLVDDLDAALWSVFFLVPVGRGATLDGLAPERAEEVMRWLKGVSESSEFGVKTTEAPHYRRVVAQAAREGGGDGPPPAARRGGITAGDGFAFVSHVGEVFPSGFLPQSVGNVRERSVVECYRETELMERLRDPDELRGKCGACEFRTLCGGSRSRAYATSGDPLGSDPLCPYVPEGYDGPLPWESREDAAQGEGLSGD